MLIGVSAGFAQSSNSAGSSPAGISRGTTQKETTWAAESKLSIPDKGDAIYADNNGNFVMVRNTLYSLRDLKEIGQFRDNYNISYPHALSAEGEYFAAVDRNGNKDAIIIWHLPTNKRIFQLNLPGSVEFVQFTIAPKLLVGFRNSVSGLQASTLNVITGEQGAVCNLKNHSHEVFCVSPDGQFFVCSGEYGQNARDNPGVDIFSLETGKIVNSLSIPPVTDDKLTFTNLYGLKFSPDGSELAVMYERPLRLMVFNQSGQMVLDLLSPAAIWENNFFTPRSWKQGFEWLPNGDGWMLYGQCIVSRETRLPVWFFNQSINKATYAKLMDQEHLLVRGSTPENQNYTRITIPWGKIRNVQKNMGKVPAHIAPGQSVSIEVKLGPIRFAKPEEVEASLIAAFTERLAMLNIKVAPDQPTKFVIQYEEKSAGPITLSYAEARLITDKELIVEGTQNDGTISMMVRGNDKPVWSKLFTDPNHFCLRSLRKGATPEIYRNEYFKQVPLQLKTVCPPYYVPKNPMDSGLPVVTQLNQALK